MAEYQELRIRFERIGDVEGGYRVFASGPAGEAGGVFRLPVSDVEIENLVLKLNRPRSGVRRIDSSELALVRTFGGALFDSLFNGRVRDVYRSSFSSARGEGRGLRISLALTGTPELMYVPWEFLFDDPAFLSISTWTPVVRYLDLSSTRRPLKVEPPLRILAMVSSPADMVQLDVKQEQAKLEESLAEVTDRGGVQIRWLEEATLQSLQRELRRADYHVFHYLGHGGYDRANDDGVLALEDGRGRSRLVSGMELATILADETTLRLAVLNACEGARSSLSDPFSGVATSLVRREIPAVVAMQLEITDRAAITFACEFYAALADGYPVDAALAEARKAIFSDDNAVEWATPVLFMRVPDGRIFDVAHPIGLHGLGKGPVRIGERKLDPPTHLPAVVDETATVPLSDGERSQQHTILNERRASHVYEMYEILKRTNTFLLVWGFTFLIATFVLAVASVSTPTVHWQLPAITGAVSLAQFVGTFFTQKLHALADGVVRVRASDEPARSTRSESERLQQYPELTERRAKDAYETVKQAYRFLLVWGATFLTATLALAVSSALNPDSVSWKLPAVTAGFSLAEFSGALYAVVMLRSLSGVRSLPTK